MTRSASVKHRNISTTNLGRVLKCWRLISDLTLRDAGKRLGIGYSTLLRIEMGHAPDMHTLLRILNWMDSKEKGKETD